MSPLLIVFAVSSYVVAFIRYRRSLAKMSFSEPISAQDGTLYETVGDIFALKLRIAQIIRLAIFEGAAFVGLIICFLAGREGLLHARPIYWLTTLPALVVVLLVAKTFPTKQRIVATFEKFQEEHPELLRT